MQNKLGKIEINKDETLTIILAMRENEDSIFIGADSLQLSSLGIKTPIKKLHEIQGCPLVWGYSGCVELGDGFSNWIKIQQISSQNWDTFERDIRNKLADINKEQREYVKRSGADWNEDYSLSCLFAGWLNNEPRIVIYDDTGTKEDCLGQGFGSIGSGKGHAAIAFETLKCIQNLPFSTRFEIVLGTTINMAKNCGMPLSILKITSKEITKVK